jgi:aconitase B
MTIDQTNSLVKKLQERNSAVNIDVNMRIKQLQRRLVELSFMEGDQSADYFAVLENIKQLRSQIFKDVAHE